MAAGHGPGTAEPDAAGGAELAGASGGGGRDIAAGVANEDAAAGAGERDDGLGVEFDGGTAALAGTRSGMPQDGRQTHAKPIDAMVTERRLGRRSRRLGRGAIVTLISLRDCATGLPHGRAILSPLRRSGVGLDRRCPKLLRGRGALCSTARGAASRGSRGRTRDSTPTGRGLEPRAQGMLHGCLGDVSTRECSEGNLVVFGSGEQ